jgi:ketosteroid isomerase-like protein
MSQENVETVRRAIEARNRDLEEWLGFFDPDVEATDQLTAPGIPMDTRGVDELRQSHEQWRDIFLNFNEEVLETLDKGEVILAEVRFHGLGGRSEVAVEASQFDFYRLREGRIIEFRAGYRSREQALEAAGCGSRQPG